MESIKYHRPLDRSQDKQFELLSQRDQSKLTALRAALERAKTRVVNLRDSNGIKDDQIDEERKLRQEAEERLDQFLVDLYGNPEVNSELRQRLPYTNKADPYIKDRSKEGLTEGNRDNGLNEDFTQLPLYEEHQYNIEETERLPMRHGSVQEVPHSIDAVHISSTIEACNVRMEETPPENCWPTSSSHSDTDRQLDGHSANASSTWSHQTRGTESHTQLESTSGVSNITVSTEGLGATQPGPLSSSSAFSAVSFTALPQRQNLANPLASASYSSLAASSYVGLPRIYEYEGLESSEPGEPRIDQDDSISISTETPSYRKGTATNIFPLSHTLPSMSGQSSLHSLYITPNISLASISSACRGPTDNVSHISRLLAEIATLKRENEELKEKLKLSEQKCEELKLGIGKPEEKKEDPDIAAMIEEIRAAEKLRDQTTKMLVQEEDKDKEIKEIFKSKGDLSRKVPKPSKTVSESEFSDMEDDGIVNTSGSSWSYSEGSEKKENISSRKSESFSDLRRGLHSRHELVEMIQRQRQIMAEELRKVIDQRNEARQKVFQLEKKLSSLELQPKTNKKSDELVATLGVVRRERDVAVARLKALMAEMAEIKMFYSFQKPLMQEDAQNENNPNLLHSKFSNTDSPLDKNNTMTSHLSNQDKVKAKLEAQLAFSNQERENQTQTIIELEQLVYRQRQKLNLLCAGPVMIDGETEIE